MKISSAVFIKSTSSGKERIIDSFPQIAIAGKSNVGKSSFINFLCNNGKLARTSSQPGRTRLINYFLINNAFYLTDLPGYGYAKVSKDELNKWATLINEYLADDKALIHIMLLIDARHAPTDNDKLMYNYVFECNIPFTLIATKADKLSKSQLQQNLRVIANTFAVGVDNIIAVSSTAKTGKETVLNRLNQILGNNNE